MKKGASLSELSLEELQKKKKTLQGAAIGLGIVMLVACITLVYLAITSKKTSLLAVVIGCSITFLPCLISLGQINSELKTRTDK